MCVGHVEKALKKCQADLMLMESASHEAMCKVCLDVCGKSCEGVDGMEDCVTACRKCAVSCPKMSA
jgi:hypothetical protein